MSQVLLYSVLKGKLNELKKVEISSKRKNILQPLIEFIQQKKDSGETVKLNFICTHNSRRSQLAQVWAKTISAYYRIETQCYSGGTEETAFHQNAVDALKRAGFRINSELGENLHFEVYYSEESQPIICYSKMYDAPENPSENFAALMTCSHADENCPFIVGSEARISLDYKDPKEFDDSPLAQKKYNERSDQIASEMIYVFENIK